MTLSLVRPLNKYAPRRCHFQSRYVASYVKICMTLLETQMADLLFYVKLNILYMYGALQAVVQLTLSHGFITSQ